MFSRIYIGSIAVSASLKGVTVEGDNNNFINDVGGVRHYYIHVADISTFF